MDDQNIIALFFSRDENAIKESDAVYGAKLKRISYGITDDKRDAEECVSDAYLAAWNKIPPERPLSLFAYLCGIVRRTSLTKYRYNTAQKRGVHTVSIDSELSEVVADTRDDTSGLAELLNVFLSELPDDTRFIFMRRYYYADDISAIAKMTGLSKNSVSARLMRARKKLAEQLQRKGYKYENN
ncbi:MAG: RNA polymerase sigma factor [Clostridia bacterium]|nr:RNA polymerase sigma factor [Clostridia bacterium]